MRDLNNNSRQINLFRLIFIWIVVFILGVLIGIGMAKDDDFLCFVGSIIGVIGAFILFKYQYYYTKNEESQLSKEVIKNLLSYTVFETESFINYMIDTYINISLKNQDDKILEEKIKGKNQGGSYILSNGKPYKFYFRYTERTFPQLIEILGLSDSEILLYESCLITEKGEDNIIDTKNNCYSKIRENIINKVGEINNFESVIYIDNWIEYLYKINDIDLKNNKNILLWFDILKKTITEIIKKRNETKKTIMNLESELKRNREDDLFKDEKEFLLHENLYTEKIEEIKLKKDILSHICNFVYYRDEMIKILRNYFKEDNLCTSTEKLNEKFDDIKSRK